MRERERASENVGLSEERESCFLVFFKKKAFSSFIIILFKLCHMFPFEWSKKGPLSLLDCDPYTATESEKNLTFGTLKSCLGLRVVSLVPVLRVFLRPSGPVFESRQYIYQNAQNKATSVIQRLFLLNFKLHAKR